MIKYAFLTVKLSMASLIVLAQSTELMQVIPPSPTSQEFDKYINYEVSLYNGVPEISIPLYEIPLGGTTIPVTLNYHASGIKYGQASGEVGVGWVLNPGYRISRTIYGRADEFFEKPVINLSGFGGNRDQDEYLTNFISLGIAVDPDLPTPTAYYDGEFDLFTYSTLSGGGTFFIKDRVSKEIKLVTHSTSSISYSVAQSGALDYFCIIDGDGRQYRFGKSISSGSTVIERNLDPNSGSATSSWLLTDMEDSFGNYARFSYQTFQEHNDLTGAQNLIVSPGYDLSIECQGRASISPSSQTPMTYEVQRMNQIDTEQIIARFHRHGSGGMLDSIIINNNANGDRLRKITFYYSNNAIHTFLDSVLVYGKDNHKPLVHRFEYNGKDDYSGVNGYLAADYWGYYKENSELYPQYPDFIETYVCDISSPIYLGEFMTKINKNPEINEATLFTLERITYPTGGSTLYEFESNKYHGYRDDGAGNTKYAGIRVKEILSDDLVTGETLKKVFKYGDNEDGFGNVNIDIAVNSLFITYRLGAVCVYDNNMSYVSYILQRVFNSQFTNEIGSAMGSPVHYANVTEYQINPSHTTTSPGSTNGKIEYRFDLSSDVSQTGFSNNSQFDAVEGIRYGSNPTCVGNGYLEFSGGLNPYIVGYEKWNKPVLQFKSIYSSDSSGYTLISKEEYEYEIQSHVSFDGLKVRRFVYSDDNYTPLKDYYAHGLNSLFDYAGYYVNCANKVLTKKLLTTYSENDSIQQETKLFYNSDFQLAREEKKNSDGSLITTRYKYPVDFGTITATDEISSGIQTLKDEHVLNSLIEKITEVRHSGSTDQQLVNAIFHAYHTNKPLTSKVMVLNAPGIITDFDSSHIDGGAIILDNRYDELVAFDIYDDNGNILQQHKSNDYLRSYIWGYQSKYPIAEIENASYQQIVSVLGQSILDQLNTNPGTDENVRGILQGLRNAPTLQDAAITTYTFKPLTGMTSKTDPNGQTTYFEYDAFGRLLAVKDHNQNVVKTFSYHYKNQ